MDSALNPLGGMTRGLGAWPMPCSSIPDSDDRQTKHLLVRRPASPESPEIGGPQEVSMSEQQRHNETERKKKEPIAFHRADVSDVNVASIVNIGLVAQNISHEYNYFDVDAKVAEPYPENQHSRFFREQITRRGTKLRAPGMTEATPRSKRGIKKTFFLKLQ
ncbi:hypothetical protein K445DRAFT_16907 [Daldinia sp. EC12]|nr:hypothetical protein K445DRAFT_16907 [Daldinia sp. EC12]